MLRLLLQATAALLAMAFLPSLHAQSLVQLDVVDRQTGQTLPQWPHQHERWVEGAPGHAYALRLTNLTDARVLVVVSVDGVNAVSGQSAKTEQAGYVLAPWQTTEIAGWRKSLQDVARFTFTSPDRSYAARTGRPDDIGVIGVAAFRERAPLRIKRGIGLPRPLSESMRGAAAPQAEAAADAAIGQQLGTGHGAREWAPVDQTRFVRASADPEQVTQLRYDSHARLLALGILPRRSYPAPHRPQAFPLDFVPDP